MGHLLNMLENKEFPLIMSLPFNRPELARAAWANGADVVKIHINVKHHASSTLFHSFEEERPAIETMLREAKGPMGIVLGASVQDAAADYDKAVAAGFDFISLYGQHTPVNVAAGNAVNKMIAPDNTWQDWEIALLQKAGADILEASVMHPDSYGQPLSVRELVHYRHLADICPLPMVVPTQRAVQPAEVGALYSCGVKGLMIGAVVTGKEEATIASAVAAFRHAIDAMER